MVLFFFRKFLWVMSYVREWILKLSNSKLCWLRQYSRFLVYIIAYWKLCRMYEIHVALFFFWKFLWVMRYDWEWILKLSNSKLCWLGQHSRFLVYIVVYWKFCHMYDNTCGIILFFLKDFAGHKLWQGMDSEAKLKTMLTSSAFMFSCLIVAY